MGKVILVNIEKTVDLSEFTSLKIGGIAKNFYRPQTLEELKDLTKKIDYYYILGAGSNLLIDDESEFEHVIYTGDYEKKMLTMNEEGVIKASSSVKVQDLLTFANRHGYGGAEYLYSLPAMMGGIVAMNAGRGKSYNKCISDYIIFVEIVEDGILKCLSKEECGFEYRASSILNRNAIIHCVYLKFDKIQIEEGRKRLRERMEFSKSNQSLNYPSAGSVFKNCNVRVMKLVSLLPKNKKGLYYSEKTLNWISNGGKGTYKEAIKLINQVKFLHRVLGKEAELEWRIWSDTCKFSQKKNLKKYK